MYGIVEVYCVCVCIDNFHNTPPPAPAGLPAPGAECGGARAAAPLVCSGVPLLGQDSRQH